MSENVRKALKETRAVDISWLGERNMGVGNTRIGNSKQRIVPNSE